MCLNISMKTVSFEITAAQPKTSPSETRFTDETCILIYYKIASSSNLQKPVALRGFPDGDSSRWRLNAAAGMAVLHVCMRNPHPTIFYCSLTYKVNRYIHVRFNILLSAAILRAVQVE
jgi:hypothetical protein